MPKAPVGTRPDAALRSPAVAPRGVWQTTGETPVPGAPALGLGNNAGASGTGRPGARSCAAAYPFVLAGLVEGVNLLCRAALNAPWTVAHCRQLPGRGTNNLPNRGGRGIARGRKRVSA